MKTYIIILLLLISILSCRREINNKAKTVEVHSKSTVDSNHLDSKFLKENPKKEEPIQEYNHEAFIENFSLIYGRWNKVGFMPSLARYPSIFSKKYSNFIEFGPGSIFREYIHEELKRANKYTLLSDGTTEDVIIGFADYPAQFLYMRGYDTIEIHPYRTHTRVDIYVRVDSIK